MRLNQFSKNMLFGDNGFLNKHLPPDNEPAEDERKDTYNFLDLEKCRVSQGIDWDTFALSLRNIHRAIERFRHGSRNRRRYSG